MAETPTQTPSPSSGPGSAAFVFILVMVTFDFLAFGIIAPVLPDLIRQFEGGDFARASSITGYLLFAWNAMHSCFRRFSVHGPTGLAGGRLFFFPASGWPSTTS